jgi:hypothetical protein
MQVREGANCRYIEMRSRQRRGSLETEEGRSREYAEFVDKGERFVTREGKREHHA